MSNLTRRAFVAGGVVAAGATVGDALSAAGRRFGLVPPDCGGHSTVLARRSHTPPIASSAVTRWRASSRAA